MFLTAVPMMYRWKASREGCPKRGRKRRRCHCTDTGILQTAKSIEAKCTVVGLNEAVSNHFCRAMRCISASYVGIRCPSVRLSVTFVDHVKTNKHIFKFFSPSGSHTIPVFPIPTGVAIFRRQPPNEGVECKGYEKMTILDQYLALSEKRL